MKYKCGLELSLKLQLWYRLPQMISLWKNSMEKLTSEQKSTESQVLLNHVRRVKWLLKVPEEPSVFALPTSCCDINMTWSINNIVHAFVSALRTNHCDRSFTCSSEMWLVSIDLEFVTSVAAKHVTPTLFGSYLWIFQFNQNQNNRCERCLGPRSRMKDQNSVRPKEVVWFRIKLKQSLVSLKC